MTYDICGIDYEDLIELSLKSTFLLFFFSFFFFKYSYNFIHTVIMYQCTQINNNVNYNKRIFRNLNSRERTSENIKKL